MTFLCFTQLYLSPNNNIIDNKRLTIISRNFFMFPGKKSEYTCTDG